MLMAPCAEIPMLIIEREKVHGCQQSKVCAAVRVSFPCDRSGIWGVSVLALTSSAVLPEQTGLLRKFPFSIITEILLLICNRLGDEFCLRLTGVG